MNVVILHCHLERGGVTQVIENHVRALRQRDPSRRLLLVSGSRQSGLDAAVRQSTEQAVVDDFDYDPETLPAGSCEPRAAALFETLTEQLAAAGMSPDDTVLHWHNHSLGKNSAGPGVIRRLAEAGWRLLLQIHDFAEDNRPANYARLIRATAAADRRELDRYLYPVARQIHYATLTEADREVIHRLGVPEAQTHCLPNSVVGVSSDQGDHESSLAAVRDAFALPDDAGWCLYPVRGIRRKNVGEFLLLSRWLPEHVYAGLTLRPATPVEARSYDRWRQLAGVVAPRAVFDAAHHPEISFGTNLAASDVILSTSVAEGFGMAFLEPWLAARGVIARRIATVTDDFAAAGVRLEALYDRIAIPGSEAWITACREQTRRAQRAAWEEVPETFRPPLESADEGEDRDTIDFARLTPESQTAVLRRVSEDAGFEAAVQAHAAEVVAQLGRPIPEAVIAHNKDVIGRVYAPESQGATLEAVYQQLAESACDREVVPAERAGHAVEWIAQVRPFFPCRTENWAVEGH